MFDPAIAAARAAAATWSPDVPDPVGGHGCCTLCFRRYRMLVLDGPLRGLPHGVAHPVVRTVDELIGARVDAAASSSRDSGSRATRRAEASGALLVVALEELGAADALLAELRRRFTEPAVQAYLEQHRGDDRPWTGS